MLRLLTTFEAATVIYCLFDYTINNEKNKDLELAFTPEIMLLISNQEVNKKVQMYQSFIKNAINAEVLPALIKAKGKASDKKLFNSLEISEEHHGQLKQFDYWVTLEDLFAFLERPHVITPNDYAHGRDALVRLLCSFLYKEALDPNAIKPLEEFLAHQIETAENDLGFKLMLGDNTLKGCCREILDTYGSINSTATNPKQK